MKNFYHKGITLVEVLIVIAIIGILAAIVFPQFSKIKKNQVLKNGVADTMSAINKARTQTLASLNSSEYGVHFQSDSVIIFKGKTFSSGATDNETIDIIPPATISVISLSGGVSGVYFNRLNSTPSATGTVTITNSTLTKIITISATGIASTN